MSILTITFRKCSIAGILGGVSFSFAGRFALVLVTGVNVIVNISTVLQLVLSIPFLIVTLFLLIGKKLI